MKPIIRLALTAIVPLLTAAVPAVRAQQTTDAGRVLVVQREFTKPGRDGAAHEATESAFVRAMMSGKGKVRYVAMTSMTGPSRALFLSEYPSFAAWESLEKSVGPVLGAALDKANLADGDLLSATDASVWIRRDDLSSNVDQPPVGTRYLEITQFVIKPGHVHEFEELTKMYMAATKGTPEMHWTTYEMAYGHADGPVFVALTALKSASEVDAEFRANQDMMKSASESDFKKMGDLESSCIATEMTNLFSINPRMSIPPDDVAAQEPDFWHPKPTATPAAKRSAAAAKPANTTGQ